MFENNILELVNRINKMTCRISNAKAIKNIKKSEKENLKKLFQCFLI